MAIDLRNPASYDRHEQKRELRKCSKCGLIANPSYNTQICHIDAVGVVPHHWQPLDMNNENVTLSLLVIDVGESTIIKLEQGTQWNWQRSDRDYYSVAQTRPITLIPHPFAEIRAAIDKLFAGTLAAVTPPVPRMEVRGNGYILIGSTSGEKQLLSEGLYNSLTILTQKRLPIYSPSRGIWTQIVNYGYSVNENVLQQGLAENIELHIWRFQLIAG